MDVRRLSAVTPTLLDLFRRLTSFDPPREKLTGAPWDGYARIDRVYMSGTDATLTMKAGQTISVEELTKALKDNGIKLESFKSEQRKKAKAAYVIETTGLT